MVTDDSIYDPNNPNKKSDQTDLAAPDLSGQSATSSSTSTPGAGGAKGPSSSGLFTNLNSYMNANKDFAQDQGGLAGKMVNNIQNATNQNSQQIQQAQGDFQQGADANKSKYDRPDLMQQAFQDPTTFVTDQDKMNQWGNVRNAQYTGPQGLEDVQGANNMTNLKTGAQNVQDMTNAATNENGRFSLLSQMFGRNNYSSGQQKLDNLLVQGNQDQFNQLNNARVYGAQATSQLNNAETQAQQTAQDYANKAQNIQNTVQSTLGDDGKGHGQLGELTTDLSGRVTDAQNNANNFISDVQNRTLSTEEARALGISNGQETYGVNLNSGLNANNIYNPNYATTASANNVANQGDYTKYSALTQLLGLDPTLLTGSYDASKAFDPNKAVNANNLQAAIATAKSNYEGAYNPLNDAYNANHNWADFKTQEMLNDYINYENAIGQSNPDLQSHYMDVSQWWNPMNAGQGDTVGSAGANAFNANENYANQIGLVNLMNSARTQQQQQLQADQDALFHSGSPFYVGPQLNDIQSIDSLSAQQKAMLPYQNLGPTLRDMTSDISGYQQQAAAKQAALQALAQQYGIGNTFKVAPQAVHGPEIRPGSQG